MSAFVAADRSRDRMTAVAADVAIDPKMRLDDPAMADEIVGLVVGYIEPRNDPTAP
jgi:hypothetical protein